MPCISVLLEDDGVLTYCVPPILGFRDDVYIRKLKLEAAKVTFKRQRKPLVRKRK